MKTVIWIESVLILLLVAGLAAVAEQYQYEMQVNEAAVNEIDQIRTPIIDCSDEVAAQVLTGQPVQLGRAVEVIITPTDGVDQ